jgi:hypothetical protein
LKLELVTYSNNYPQRLYINVLIRKHPIHVHITDTAVAHRERITISKEDEHNHGPLFFDTAEQPHLYPIPGKKCSIVAAFPETVGLICTGATKLTFLKSVKLLELLMFPTLKQRERTQPQMVHIPFPSVLNVWLTGMSDAMFIEKLNKIQYRHCSTIGDVTAKKKTKKQNEPESNIPTVRKRRSSLVMYNPTKTDIHSRRLFRLEGYRWGNLGNDYSSSAWNIRAQTRHLKGHRHTLGI